MSDLYKLRDQLREAIRDAARLRALAEYEDAREADREVEALRRQIAEMELTE